jgi:hypothetical protein
MAKAWNHDLCTVPHVQRVRWSAKELARTAGVRRSTGMGLELSRWLQPEAH